MALSWDLTGIKDKDTVCWTPRPKGFKNDGMFRFPEKGRNQIMNPVTQGLIFITLAIGIGEITPRTVDEFARRIEEWQKVSGPWLTGRNKKDDRYITADDVKAHMGLRTNVFPRESRRKFEKKLASVALEKVGVRARL